jgi:AraC-like DNA-binding protein
MAEVAIHLPGSNEPAAVAGLAVMALGIHWAHELGYTVDRPHGMGEYVLLRFYSPMLVRTAAGMVHGKPGSCLLYTPEFPEWFSGRDVGHADDFVHLDGPDVPMLIGRYRVPVNLLFQPREVDFIPTMIAALSRELHGRELYWEQSVRTLVEWLLLRLGRLANEQESPDLTAADLAQAEVFRMIRTQIHERLQEHWTVGRMARMANLSASRFGVLYRKLFDVSPLEDLIEARLRRARMLLANAALSVGEAAAEAGFPNACYFSRLFRRRVGVSPRDYYRRALGGDEQGEASGTADPIGRSRVRRGFRR